MTAAAEPPVISLEQVTHRFGRAIALDGVSLSVASGQILALLGPNGAGKTTTIKILTTLLRPTSGRVRVGGIDPVANAMEARRQFGIVFQDPSVDTELTALENMRLQGVMYGMRRRALDDRVEALLRGFELWDRRDESVKGYSAGMRRRLEIARGLLHAPRVLFLDEPSVGLDPQTRRHLWGLLSRLNQEEGVTVFLTTHYLEEAERIATRIAVIDAGVVVADGTASSLKARTRTATLEDAFLAVTGLAIRDDGAAWKDEVRAHARVGAGAR